MNITDILNYEPQLKGFEINGKEPCLESLIMNYYRSHFTRNESIKYTKQYIKQLTKMCK